MVVSLNDLSGSCNYWEFGDLCNESVEQGFSDWFTPDLGHFEIMSQNIGPTSILGNIGLFQNQLYWTWSGCGGANAYVYNLHNNVTECQAVGDVYRCRAIRSF